MQRDSDHLLLTVAQLLLTEVANETQHPPTKPLYCSHLPQSCIITDQPTPDSEYRNDKPRRKVVYCSVVILAHYITSILVIPHVELSNLQCACSAQLKTSSICLERKRKTKVWLVTPCVMSTDQPFMLILFLSVSSSSMLSGSMSSITTSSSHSLEKEDTPKKVVKLLLTGAMCNNTLLVISPVCFFRSCHFAAQLVMQSVGQEAQRWLEMLVQKVITLRQILIRCWSLESPLAHLLLSLHLADNPLKRCPLRDRDDPTNTVALWPAIHTLLSCQHHLIHCLVIETLTLSTPQLYIGVLVSQQTVS